MNLYGYVGDEPLDRIDPTGAVCADGDQPQTGTRTCDKQKVRWGQEHSLGDGFTARPDLELRNPTRSGYEIHVFKGEKEVGIFSAGKFVGRHGFTDGVMPSGFSKESFNALKGLDIAAGRLTSLYPERGTANFKGADYGSKLGRPGNVGSGGRAVMRSAPVIGVFMTASYIISSLSEDYSEENAKALANELVGEVVCGLVFGCGTAE